MAVADRVYQNGRTAIGARDCGKDHVALTAIEAGTEEIAYQVLAGDRLGMHIPAYHGKYIGETAGLLGAIVKGLQMAPGDARLGTYGESPRVRLSPSPRVSSTGVVQAVDFGQGVDDSGRMLLGPHSGARRIFAPV